ncbi:HAD-IA family hydrolase [Acetobacter sp. DsW_063]|uniref:HAD-IA family hydrolase n=1 Tax=Acetobacter sp. DsW_063 TaxID=1514894 RepID=UPI000A390E97|nr:HAD-IA family hydrolase [Acetobacter sp. DsW_063]OUJ14809.1 glycerol-3-phosphatase [Acetobacter sp. DsW_063]
MSKELFPGKYFDALLFDMDGTVLTSIVAAERVWSAWGAKHGVDVKRMLKMMHGVRAVETVRAQNLVGIDPEAEAKWINDQEIEDVDGVDAVPGVIRFLNSLPEDRWCIVTSAPRTLALHRLRVAHIPVPRVLITAEDVERGKPVPDCFILGANELGFEAANCCVFEDAYAGIRAARAAGSEVVIVSYTHKNTLDNNLVSIHDYEKLSVDKFRDGRLTLLKHAITDA